MLREIVEAKPVVGHGQPAAEEPSDDRVRAWIHSIQDNNAEAVASFHEHFRPHVQQFVERKAGPAVRRWTCLDLLVGEVLYETLVNLKSLSDGATERDVLARLYRVATSRTCDAARRHSREAGFSALPGDHIERAQLSTHVVTRNDSVSLLEKIVETLDPSEQEIWRLRVVDELPFNEIADTLQVTPDAARMRYAKVRSIIAARLDPEHGH